MQKIIYPSNQAADASTTLHEQFCKLSKKQII